MTAATVMLIHSVTQEYEANTHSVKALKQDADNLQTLEDWYIQMIADIISKSMVYEKDEAVNLARFWVENETQFTATECRDLGLIDDIMPYADNEGKRR